MIILLLLENGLRLFGVFWIFGGFLALKMARDSLFFDDCLEELESKNVDRLTTYFGFLAGILTLLSGVGLLLNNNKVVIILIILIISQLVYFKIKNNRLKKATSPEDIEEYTIKPSTYNAFLTTIYVTIATVIKIILQIILSLN